MHYRYSGDTSIIRHPSPRIQRQAPSGLIPGYVPTTSVSLSQLKGGFRHWHNGVWCRREVSICWMERAGVRWEQRWRRSNVTGKTTTSVERRLETAGVQGQQIQDVGLPGRIRRRSVCVKYKLLFFLEMQFKYIIFSSFMRAKCLQMRFCSQCTNH